MGRITLIAVIMLAVFCVASRATADAASFDGKWDVTLVCPQSPDGAPAFSYEFSADVNNAMLHGEYGTPGSPGWMELNGTIQPNGDASMKAHGLTGRAAYNLKNTARGVPYTHPVTAHFEGSHGKGTWAATRNCDFTFTRM